MSNPDWRSENCDAMKQTIIGKPWGTELSNEYLWYFIEDGEHMRLQVKDFVGAHFHAAVHFGDIEQHPCQTIPGTSLLRLRGSVRLLPAVTIQGKRLPLFQVGHGQDPSAINFEKRWPTQR